MTETPAHLRAPLRRHGGWKPAFAAAAALALAVAAAFGGLRTQPAPPAHALATGASIDAGQWRIRPLRAWLGERCAMDGSFTPAGRFLSVEAEMTNLTPASSNLAGEPYQLIEPPLPRSERPSLELVRDRGVLDFLHPQMPERIVLCWKLDAAAPPPVRVVVAIRASTFKERDNLLGAEGWFNPKEVARATLPLGEPDADALRAATGP